MFRYLLWSASVLLAAAPCGAGVGVWLATCPGWGIAAGCVGYGALSVFVLTADLLPSPAPREVTR